MAEKEIVDRPLPDLDLLEERLTSALGEARPVRVLHRRQKQSGSFPKEVVECQLDDGRELKLFCKYSAPRFEAFGHRRGIPYEAAVYERVLSRLSVPLPSMRGAHLDKRTGEAWLFIDFLEGGSRVSTRWKELDVASTWIGEFHRLLEGADHEPAFDFLIRYDRPYYEGWAERTASYSTALHGRRPWLPELCRAFPSFVNVLTRGPQTIVHGEYTIHNVMLMGPDAYPTDWESAAVGFGEIDLVCLLDNWTDELIDASTAAYAAARWPSGAPDDYEERLLLAELYLHLRWLGEDPEVMTGSTPDRRLGRLESIASQLDIPGVPA